MKNSQLYKKYIFSKEEYEALDKLLSVSNLYDSAFYISQNEKDGDYFVDGELKEKLSLKDGLQIIYESHVHEISFDDGDITSEEYEIIQNLFEKFNIERGN